MCGKGFYTGVEVEWRYFGFLKGKGGGEMGGGRRGRRWKEVCFHKAVGNEI